MEEAVTVQWSVGIEVTGDEVMTPDRICDLADAVASANGIASGIGRPCYGVKVLVEADDRDEAVAKATEILRAAARAADRRISVARATASSRPAASTSTLTP